MKCKTTGTVSSNLPGTVERDLCTFGCYSQQLMRFSMQNINGKYSHVSVFLFYRAEISLVTESIALFSTENRRLILIVKWVINGRNAAAESDMERHFIDAFRKTFKGGYGMLRNWKYAFLELLLSKKMI